MDELSFLSVECRRLGGPAFIQPVLIDTYIRETGDDPPGELVQFYKAFRAFLRAQMAIWHLRDPAVKDAGKWTDRAERNVELAEHLITESSELSAQPSKSSSMDPPP